MTRAARTLLSPAGRGVGGEGVLPLTLAPGVRTPSPLIPLPLGEREDERK